MKIFLTLVTLFLCQSLAFKTFFENDPDQVKEALTANDWNVYVIYFYDKIGNLDDRVLRSHLTNDILNIYGENVYYAEIDISYQRNQELLNLVNFDQDREVLVKGHARPKDVPFVLLVCHGMGWVLQGDNAHHHINRYMDELIRHAERSETVANEVFAQ